MFVNFVFEANKKFVKNCNFSPKIVFVFLTSEWMEKFKNVKIMSIFV